MKHLSQEAYAQGRGPERFSTFPQKNVQQSQNSKRHTQGPRRVKKKDQKVSRTNSLKILRKQTDRHTYMKFQIDVKAIIQTFIHIRIDRYLLTHTIHMHLHTYLYIHIQILAYTHKYTYTHHTLIRTYTHIFIHSTIHNPKNLQS